MATYKHDALGRRVEKDLGTSRERYVYSGFETVSVYDSSDTWVRDFVFGQGIDEPLMLRQADVTDFDGDQDTSEVTRHYYHRNALDSVLLLTDMNEAEGVSYRYDPYGAVTISVGGTPQSTDPLGNPWMFTARFQDEETGLMYYRARSYSPSLGRFLQRDALGPESGSSLYSYCRSAPTVFVDPAGLQEGAGTTGEMNPNWRASESDLPTDWNAVTGTHGWAPPPPTASRGEIQGVNSGLLGCVSMWYVDYNWTSPEERTCKTVHCGAGTDLDLQNMYNRLDRRFSDDKRGRRVCDEVVTGQDLCVEYEVCKVTTTYYSQRLFSSARFRVIGDWPSNWSAFVEGAADADVATLFTAGSLVATYRLSPLSKTAAAVAAEATTRITAGMAEAMQNNILRAMSDKKTQFAGWSSWTFKLLSTSKNTVYEATRKGKVPCDPQLAGSASDCEAAVKTWRLTQPLEGGGGR